MKQKKLLSLIEDNKNSLNSDIMNFKKIDYRRIVSIIEMLCKTLEISENIVFSHLDLITDESEIQKLKRNIPLEDTRVFKVICYFNLKDENGEFILNAKNEIQEEKFEVLVPKLIKDSYFIIKGVRYAPIIQVIDYLPIIKNNEIIIKTTINKLSILLKNLKNGSINGEIELFGKTNSILNILFSLEDPVFLMNEVFGTNGYYFSNKKTTDIYIELEKKHYLNFVNLDLDIHDKRYFLYNFLKNGKIKDSSYLENSQYFIKQLGSKYTTNSNTYEDKGRKILYSLKRMLDPITKSFLKVDSMVELIFGQLERKETYHDTQMNLLNKRLRFAEWVLYPLSKRLSDNLYIYLNSNHKTTSKLVNIFKIDPYLILSYLVTSDLCRYDDSCNPLSVINSTKGTFLGSTLSGLSDQISNDLRMIDKSFIDRIDLITTPTGPGCGLTFQFSATNKNLFNESGLFNE